MNTEYKQIKGFNLEFVRVPELFLFIRDYIKAHSGDKDFILPLSPQKAINLVNNPCASDTDIGLIVIYHGTACIGYLGLIPDNLIVNSNVIKLFWMSPWFIHENYRGKGIGSMLVKELQNLQYTIGSIHPLNGAYTKMGFFSIPPLVFYRINFLRISNLAFHENTPKLVSKAILKISNCIKTSFLCFGKLSYNRSRNLYEEECNKIEYNFEKYNGKQEGFNRNIKKINTMLAFPWILEEEKTNNMNYHFSHSREIFKYKSYYIKDKKNNKISGFVIFMVSRSNQKTFIKICDFDAPSIQIVNQTIALMFMLAKMYSADYIEFPKEFINAISNVLFKLLLERHQREYIFKVDNPEVRELIQQAKVQIHDGDQAYY